MKPILSKIIIFSFLLAFIIPNLTSAEIKTFIKEYSYLASEDDSRNSSRTIALREVKRLLLEELGSYLESETEVKDFQLTKDQITTLTAGIIRTEIIAEKWDGQTYWLRAKITSDSNEVIKSIDLLRKDRRKTKELEELRRRSDELLRQNERLRKELAMAKGEMHEKHKTDYEKNVIKLTANEWFEKGYSLMTSGNYTEATDAFSKAIELNPNDYFAFYNRGRSYLKLNNYEQAIKNSTKAIELNDKNSNAFIIRGFAYDELHKYEKAIIDYSRSIELDPNNIIAYQNRAVAFNRLGNYEKAIADLDTAINLGSNNSIVYIIRGISYEKLGNLKQAVNDISVYIKLNPRDADAYFRRAIVYEELGNNKEYMNNMKIAATLGNKTAQDSLKEQGIKW